MSRTGPVASPAALTVHSTAIIAQDTDLRGDITIESGVVIHPKATILALGGPIVLGKECIVEELAVIVNRNKTVMRIGDHNHFMVACRIESPSIGSYNTFQPRCKASSAVAISDNCTLGAGTILLPSPAADSQSYDSNATNATNSKIETLEPYSVIYGSSSELRTWDGSGQLAERSIRSKHIEYLREIIPK
ncbi:hypothetical protein IAU59_005743 [Kwoniella sp. CBS 9459]